MYKPLNYVQLAPRRARSADDATRTWYAWRSAVSMLLRTPCGNSRLEMSLRNESCGGTSGRAVSDALRTAGISTDVSCSWWEAHIALLPGDELPPADDRLLDRDRALGEVSTAHRDMDRGSGENAVCIEQRPAQDAEEGAPRPRVASGRRRRRRRRLRRWRGRRRRSSGRRRSLLGVRRVGGRRTLAALRGRRADGRGRDAVLGLALSWARFSSGARSSSRLGLALRLQLGLDRFLLAGRGQLDLAGLYNPYPNPNLAWQWHAAWR